MNKICEDIIYEYKNIYQIFDRIYLGKGALDRLYEKYVIHFMKPDKYTVENKLFNLFDIKEIIEVVKFLPAFNEKYYDYEFKQRSIEEDHYLFKQKNLQKKFLFYYSKN